MPLAEIPEGTPPEGKVGLIYSELTARYRGNYDEEWDVVWAPYILEQDNVVLVQALALLNKEAGPDDWVPSLNKFADCVARIHRRRLQAEASAKAMSACKVCEGTTWVEVEGNETYPCPECLPESHTRWLSNRYRAFSILEDDSELTGPPTGANFPEASPPWTSTAEPVSAERVRSYLEFIIHGNGEQDVDEYRTNQLKDKGAGG